MTPLIQPYEYNFIKTQIMHLVRTYQTVNDKQTIRTVEAMTQEKIRELGYPEEILSALMLRFFDSTLSNSQREVYFDELKEWVIPFEAPSEKQVEKAFRKVKKLKIPHFTELDLRNYTYIGWDDIGSQSKFILLRNGQLTGLHGHLGTAVTKGVCAICQKEANVSMFLALTKMSGDGTYTKNGNYICRDSEACNRQLENRESLDVFAEVVKAK